MYPSTNNLFDGLNRKDYIDLEPGAFPAPGEYDYVMLKYDGIWSRATFSGQKVNYYSRTNNLKKSKQYDLGMVAGLDKTVILGEYMFGQQWAQRLDRLGKLFVFDALMINDKDLTSKSFLARHSELNLHFRNANRVPRFTDIIPVQVYYANKAKELWNDCVLRDGFEGLVFVKSNGNYAKDVYARMKQKITQDVYIIGFTEGTNRLKGSLGACIVSDYKNGKRTCDVGGGFSDELRQEIWNNRSKYLGKCMVVEANKRFDSGALRSPNFVNFHLEK